MSSTTSESVPAAAPDHAVVNFPYAPLPDGEEGEAPPIPSAGGGRSIKPLVSLALSLAALVLLALGLALTGNNGGPHQPMVLEVHGPGGGGDAVVLSRGVSEGVSEKSVQMLIEGGKDYGWTKEMLTWERTAFHFQPEKNWMNGI